MKIFDKTSHQVRCEVPIMIQVRCEVLIMIQSQYLNAYVRWCQLSWPRILYATVVTNSPPRPVQHTTCTKNACQLGIKWVSSVNPHTNVWSIFVCWLRHTAPVSAPSSPHNFSANFSGLFPCSDMSHSNWSTSDMLPTWMFSCNKSFIDVQL